VAEEPEKQAHGADLVIPALAFAFSLYFFFSIADLTWEAMANGVLIGSVLAGLCLIQVVRIAMRVASARATLAFDALVQPREAIRSRLGILAVTALFIGTMPWLGLTLGMLVWMAAGLYVMGVRKPARLAVISATAAAIVYLMFILVLRAEFPHGPIERGITAIVAATRS
jgi:hypothetical protein